jgi:hypothetical protein
MQDQFTSFEKLSDSQSSAWIPRVFSHLAKKSESMPTDIDNSGLHILTSFAPWGATEQRRSSSFGYRTKSISAEPKPIDRVSSVVNNTQEIESIIPGMERSPSKHSVHARSLSLPANFLEYSPNFFSYVESPIRVTNDAIDASFVKLGEAHSVMFEGSGLSMFTVFIIEMELVRSLNQKSTFKIKKRYSEFKDLHINLAKLYGIRLPPFPPKTVIGKLILLKLGQFSSLIIKSRMTKFIQLLEFILHNPILKNSTLFLQFLGLDKEETIEDDHSDHCGEIFPTAMQL